MQVPIIDRQVKESAIQIDTPHISGAVPGAFGEQIGAATKEAGQAAMKVGEMIALHVQKQNEWKSTERGQAIGNKLTELSLNELSSTATEEVQNPDGTVTKRPYGILNQTGHAADDAALRYKQRILTHHQNLLAQIKDDPVALATYQKQANSIMESGYKTAITHQSTEWHNAAKASIVEFTDTELQRYPLADVIDKKEIISGVDSRVNQALKSGIIDYNEAQKIKTGFYVDSTRVDIYNDTETQEDKSPVLAELKKGKDGAYGFLPEPEKTKMMEEAQRRIFQNNQTFKRSIEISQQQRHNTLIDKEFSENLTLKDIDNELTVPEEAGGVKKSILLSYRDKLTKGIHNDLSSMFGDKSRFDASTQKKIKGYLDLIDSFIDDKTDSWYAKEQLAKSYADGEISKTELRFLNNLENNLRSVEANRSTWPVANNIKGFINTLKRWNATDEEVARNLKKLLGTGNITPATVDQALKGHLKAKIPDLETLSTKGQLMIDGQENLWLVYPDGTMEPYTEPAKPTKPNAKD